MSLDDTLQARGGQYGRFDTQAKASQTIKAAFAQCDNWTELDDDAREALETIAMKISRLLTGNPKHYDSWHDIAGYAELVAKRIKPPEEKAFITSQPYYSELSKQ